MPISRIWGQEKTPAPRSRPGSASPLARSETSAWPFPSQKRCWLASNSLWEKCPPPEESGLDVRPARGRTAGLKLKSYEQDALTRQTTFGRAVREIAVLLALAEGLLRRPRPPTEAVRFLGGSVSSLTTGRTRAGEQLELGFTDGGFPKLRKGLVTSYARVR